MSCGLLLVSSDAACKGDKGVSCAISNDELSFRDGAPLITALSSEGAGGACEMDGGDSSSDTGPSLASGLGKRAGDSGKGIKVGDVSY